MMEEKAHPFISYLQGLVDKQDRGALAALRRGLGKPPGTEAAMYPYVVRFLPEERYKEPAYYLVASLFAFHPKSAIAGDMGAHLKQFALKKSDQASTDRRFTALLNTQAEDLQPYLQQVVSLLKSKDVPVNWQQLLIDLMQWGNPEKYVQQRWARSFWGDWHNLESNQ